jgi:hypothetical protein
MSRRSLTCSLILAIALMGTLGRAGAADAPSYPDWGGQWERFVVRGLPGQPSHDQTKPWGLGQEAPLTPEYKKVLLDSMADQAQGGVGNFPTAFGRAAGMPYMMMAFGPMEWVVTPRTTYIMIGWHDHYRRIYTDGRDWPAEIVPTYAGYSIGRWIDSEGSGTYDTLLFETRGFKGPRSVDETGLPLATDNQSIFKERVWRDKINPRILHDEMTIIDHAFTRPWTVDKRYVLNRDPRPDWEEYYTTDNNAQIRVGKENYFLSWDGLLMPARKNQEPPDLRYFNQAR